MSYKLFISVFYLIKINKNVENKLVLILHFGCIRIILTHKITVS